VEERKGFTRKIEDVREADFRLANRSLRPVGSGQLASVSEIPLTAERRPLLSDYAAAKATPNPDVCVGIEAVSMTWHKCVVSLNVDAGERRIALYLFCTCYSGFEGFWRFEQLKTGVTC
jgi:hypothetical protein